jgi:hypothetical protein
MGQQLAVDLAPIDVRYEIGHQIAKRDSKQPTLLVFILSRFFGTMSLSSLTR